MPEDHDAHDVVAGAVGDPVVAGQGAAAAPPLPRFRSPLRGPWLTSVFGAVLLVALPVVILTGLLELRRLRPRFGQADPGRRRRAAAAAGSTGRPRRPGCSGSPRALHVGLGLVAGPGGAGQAVVGGAEAVRLAAGPLARRRRWSALSLLLLVGGILFEIVTGVLNIQYDYVFGFSFYAAHYVGAWVFIGGVRRARRAQAAAHGARRCGRGRCAPSCAPRSPRPEPEEPRPRPGLVAADPAPPTISRRGALALVGGGSLLVAALTAGQTLGGPLRGLALPAAPRAQHRRGDGGPNDFPVNRTFAAAGIAAGATGPAWRLELTGGAAPVRLRPRRAGRAAPAHRDAADRLRRGLVDRADLDRGAAARPGRARRGPRAGVGAWCARSSRGPFAQATLHRRPGAATRTRCSPCAVNGADLGPDHGYPARVIVPALPGVHYTKWVRSIEFRSA